MSTHHHSVNDAHQQLSGDQAMKYLPESESRPRSVNATVSINVEDDPALSGWELGHLIGTGAWSKASTYIALNLSTGALFAVKQVNYSEIKTETTPEDNKVQCMRRDLVLRLIDLVSRLNHQNVVQYFGNQLDGSIHSMSMQYLPGGSLRDFYRIYGKLQMTTVSRFARQILLGLAYLHEENIMHRDLKTDKILLDSSGTCKISWSFKMTRVENAYTSGAKDAI